MYRLDTGLYVTKDGAYEIQRFPDGSWLLFRVTEQGREYMNDYPTKRMAVQYLYNTLAVIAACKPGQ